MLINKATSVIHSTVVNLFRDKPLLLWRRLHLNDSKLTRPIKKYAINVAPPPVRTIHRLLFPSRGLLFSNSRPTGETEKIVIGAFTGVKFYGERYCITERRRRERLHIVYGCEVMLTD